MKVLLAALLAVTLAVAARGQGCPLTASDVSKLDFSAVKTDCGECALLFLTVPRSHESTRACVGFHAAGVPPPMCGGVRYTGGLANVANVT